MPQYPIYVPMLPQAAQDCIGRIHPDGQEAFDILEREGLKPTATSTCSTAARPCMRAPVASVRSRKARPPR
jgi:arginine N-succinyltransferase